MPVGTRYVCEERITRGVAREGAWRAFGMCARKKNERPANQAKMHLDIRNYVTPASEMCCVVSPLRVPLTLRGNVDVG